MENHVRKYGYEANILTGYHWESRESNGRTTLLKSPDATLAARREPTSALEAELKAPMSI